MRRTVSDAQRSGACRSVPITQSIQMDYNTWRRCRRPRTARAPLSESVLHAIKALVNVTPKPKIVRQTLSDPHLARVQEIAKHLHWLRLREYKVETSHFILLHICYTSQHPRRSSPAVASIHRWPHQLGSDDCCRCTSRGCCTTEIQVPAQARDIDLESELLLKMP